nr:MAG TPA: hypothetical protein [Caudoviricetes sp.]
MQFTTNVQRWISHFKGWSPRFRYHSKRSGNKMIFTLKFLYIDPVSPELLEHQVKHNTLLYICHGNIDTFTKYVKITRQNGLKENLELGEYKFIINFPEKLCEKL